MANNDFSNLPFLAQPGPAPEQLPFAAPSPPVDLAKAVTEDALKKMDATTISERAMKNHVALGENSPGVDALQRYEQAGQLDGMVKNIADRAATNELIQRDTVVRAITKDAAKQGRSLSPIEEQAIYSLTQKDIASYTKNPQQFLNTEYAKKIANLVLLHNERSPFDLLRRENEAVALDSVQLFQDYVDKREGFNKLYQEAEAGAKLQSWGGWAVDRTKEVLPGYSWYQAKHFIAGAPPSPLLPGSSLESQIEYLYRLPPDEANAKASAAIKAMMVSNPGLARNFAQALISYTSKDRFWDNVLIAGGDVAALTPFKSATGLARKVGGAAADAVAAGTAKGAATSLGQSAVKGAEATATAAQRFGAAVTDLARAATSRNPSAATVASAAGDVERSSTISAMEKLQKWADDLGGRPVSSWNDLTNELMTSFDPMRVLDGPKINMSSEGTRRLVETLKNSTDTFVQKLFIDPLNLEYRLTPEVLKAVSRKAYDDFMLTYRRIEDSVIDVARGQDGIVLRMGKNNAELFNSRTEAQMMMQHVYGLPERAFNIKEYGDKYYAELFRPYDLTAQVAKDARKKDILIETGAKTPIANWFGRWAASARSADYVVPKDVRELFKVSVLGGSSLLKIATDLSREIPRIKDPSDFFKFLKHQQMMPSPTDKNKLGVFSPTVSRFETDFHGLIGRLPTDAETTAYFAQKQINDLHYLFLNTSLYLDKLSKGLLDFSLPGIRDLLLEGKLTADIPTRAEEGARVLVIPKDGQPIVVHTKYTPDKVLKPYKDMIADGSHQVIHLTPEGSKALYGSKEFTDVLKDKGLGNVEFVVVANPDSRPISPKQVPYVPGGHHIYAEGTYIRQPQLYTSEGGAVAKYFGDTNFMWAANEKTAAEFMKPLNEARQAMLEVFDKSGKLRRGLDPSVKTSWEALVKATLPFSPSEFKALFYGKNALLNPRLPFMASASNVSLINAHDLASLYPKARLVKNSDSPYNLYRGLPNVEFALERGRQLGAVSNVGSVDKPIFGINPAPRLDPMQALERSAQSFANGRYFNDLHIGTAERFLAEFGDLIDRSNPTHKVDDFLAATAAPFRTGLTGEQAIQAKAGQVYRDRWLQFMGMSRSADERFLQAQAAVVLNGVSPDLATGTRKWAYEILSDPISPFEKLKGMALHAKIGLWNPKSLLTQAAGAVHIMAVAGPELGAKAIGMSLVQNYCLRNGEEITASAGKLAQRLGYASKEQFIESTRALESTNFGHVGHEVATRQQYLGAQVLQTKLGAILDSGMLPFQYGEEFIRRAAWSASYLEWRKIEPTAKLTDKIIARILDRADEMSGNMTQASNAAWQQGALGISSQFMSYPIRLTEQLLNKKLTDRDLYKMLGVYTAAWGVPTVGALATFGMLPVHEQTKEYLLSKGINIEDSVIARLLHGGAVDLFGDFLFQRNLNFTKAYGVGSSSSFMDAMRGDKGFFSAALGAGGSVFGEALLATAPFMRVIWGVVDPWGPDAPPLKIEDFEALIAPISSAKAIDKAIVALSTGNYYSKKGELVDTGNTGIRSLLQAAFGLQPQRIDDLYSLKVSEKDRSQWLSDKQQQVYRSLEQMFKATSPEDRLAYHKKALATMVGYGFTDMERNDTMKAFFNNNRYLPVIERHLISHPAKSPREQELYDNLRKNWIINKN